jgi:hypothetical protein
MDSQHSKGALSVGNKTSLFVISNVRSVLEMTPNAQILGPAQAVKQREQNIRGPCL